MPITRFRCEQQPSAKAAMADALAPAVMWPEPLRGFGRAAFRRGAFGQAATGGARHLFRLSLGAQEDEASSAPPSGQAPAVSASASSVSPPSVPPSSGKRAAGSLDGLRILIVEDDDDARELVGIILSNAGAVVQSADSAAQAFRLVCDSPPELLVSDIGMPNEDGYSLMRRIRALECSKGGDIPAIALSAFTRPEDRMLALRAGFTLHIAKPVPPTDLVSAVALLAALMRRRDRWPS